MKNNVRLVPAEKTSESCIVHIVSFHIVRIIIIKCVTHLNVHLQGNSIAVALPCPTSLPNLLVIFTVLPHKQTLIIPVCFILLQLLIFVSRARESYKALYLNYKIHTETENYILFHFNPMLQ